MNKLIQASLLFLFSALSFQLSSQTFGARLSQFSSFSENQAALLDTSASNPVTERVQNSRYYVLSYFKKIGNKWDYSLRLGLSSLNYETLIESYRQSSSDLIRREAVYKTENK